MSNCSALRNPLAFSKLKFGRYERMRARKGIRKGLVFGIVFLLVFVVFVGIPVNVSAETQSESSESSFEILEKRDLWSKTYDLGDGKYIAEISTKPIHYYNELLEQFEDIDTTILNQDENTYVNNDNILQSEFPKTGNNFIKVINRETNHLMEFKTLEMGYSNQGSYYLIQTAQSSVAEISTNELNYYNVLPHTTEQYIVGNGELKRNYILNSLMSYPDGAENLQFVILYNIGSMDVYAGGELKESDFSTTEEIELRDQSIPPRPIFSLVGGFAYDVDGNTVHLTYDVKFESENSMLLTINVPIEWLSDANYPVIVDPPILNALVADYEGYIWWPYPPGTTDYAKHVNYLQGIGNAQSKHDPNKHYKYRPFWRYDTSSIPDFMSITNIEFHAWTVNYYETTFDFYLHHMDCNPEIADETTIWNDCDDGAVYGSEQFPFGSSFDEAKFVMIPSLSEAANSDLENQLSEDWFAIGGRSAIEEIIGAWGFFFENRIWVTYQDLRYPHADSNGPYNGNINTQINFDGSGSYDPTGYIADYQWDFGDETTGTGETISHVYSNEGFYTVGLTVYNNEGYSDYDETTVDICGNPPVANAGGPYETIEIAPISFDGSGSTDDWGIAKYEWDFDASDGIQLDAIGVNPTHAYYELGIYTITLTVTDYFGQSDSTTTTVNVKIGNPPVANPGGPYETVEIRSITFDGTGSTDDSGIVKYEWDFDASNGIQVEATGLHPTHKYYSLGTYTVTLTVTDYFDLTHSATTTATVIAGSPPIANPGGLYETFGDTYIAFESMPIYFDGRGSLDDYGIMKYEWDFDASDGIQVDSTWVRPSHIYTTIGTYIVTLTVTDFVGQTNTQTTETIVTVIDELDDLKPYGKSLYVNRDINARSPIRAYGIQPQPTYLVHQKDSDPTRYGGVGLAVDIVTETLFVTFENSGIFDIVDTQTMEILGRVTAPSAKNLAGVVMDQDKQKVYTVDRATNHLYVYSWDPFTKTLTNDITEPPYYITLSGIVNGNWPGTTGITLDEVNDLLFVADYTTTVKYYNTADWTQAGSFPVSHNAMGIAIDVNKEFVYTGCWNSFLLSRYDLRTNTETAFEIGNIDGVSSVECIVGLAVDRETHLVYVTSYPNNDAILIFDHNLNFISKTDDIGNPTGIIVPGRDISYNSLNLDKTDGLDDDDMVNPGEQITYTISYDNTENIFDVHNVVIIDTLPSETTFVSVTGSGTYDSSTHEVTWNIGAVPIGVSDSVTLKVEVKLGTPGGSIIHNAVLIDSDETQPHTQYEDTIIFNHPPQVDVGGPYSGFEGIPITFDASESFDLEGDTLLYRWDFNNDGNWNSFWYTPVPKAAYAYPDDFSGEVKVEVNDGTHSVTDIVPVTVLNIAPIVKAGRYQPTIEGLEVNFYGSFKDPGTGDTHSIKWDFGDGHTAMGTLYQTHSYANSGSYTITLTVTDDDGGIGIDTTIIEVLPNQPPIADARGPYTGFEGEQITFDASHQILDGPLYGWDLVNTGGSTYYQKVVDSVSVSEPKSLQLRGSSYYGPATVQKKFISDSGSLGYEVYVFTYYLTGTTQDIANLAFWNQGAMSLGKRFAMVNFLNDGTINTVPVSGSGGIFLQNFEAYKWYKVRVVINEIDETYNIWIDDVLLAQDISIWDSDEIEAMMLESGNAGRQVYFDNVKVFESPSDPKLIDDNFDEVVGCYDPEGDLLYYRWDFNNDGTWDTSYSTSPIATHAFGDDCERIVVLEVYDGKNTEIDTATVTVTNLAPGTKIVRSIRVCGEYILATTYISQSYFIKIEDDGSFANPQFIDDKDRLTAGAGIGDFDNDGDLDALVGDRLNTWYYEKLGPGNNFAPAVSIDSRRYSWRMDFAEADFNNDGNLDAALSVIPGNHFTIYFGNGDGTFNLVHYSVTGNLQGMDSADFNNDGNMDLITTEMRNGIYIYLGNGDGTFQSPSFISSNSYEYIRSVCAGDFDNDGNADFISNKPLHFYPGNGDGTFDNPSLLDFNSDNLAESDIDGDGNLDIVHVDESPNYGDYIHYRSGNGDGTFSYVSSTYVTDMVTGIAVVPAQGMPIEVNEGSSVPVIGRFSDLGWLDTHTATWDWGDGSLPQSGIVTEENEEPDATGTVTRDYSYGDNGEYTITLTVTDDDGGFATDTIIVQVINVPPVADAGSDLTVNEGELIYLDGSGTYDPGFLDVLTYTWDFGDGSPTVSDVFLWNPEHVYIENGIYTATLTVTDDDGETSTDSIVVTVNNVAPIITNMIGPMDPVPLGTPISINAEFTDPGSLDTHIATLDWGDNNVDDLGTVTSPIPQQTHTYEATGVYKVILKVIDDDSGIGEGIFRYVVVYDPDGGFVTGGGWIDSPEGAYTPDPTLTGKATFGFVAKYKKGTTIPTGNTEFQFHAAGMPDPTLTGKATFGFVAKYKKGTTIPTGNTEFQFHAAGMNFHSEDYQWLVVAGARAQFKGTGTINGEGDYGFILTAIDAKLTKSTDVDLFRIKIWDKNTDTIVYDTDTIVYDNMLGTDDDEDLDPIKTELGSGSIVIHKR
jgi:uncharacterized repeat protein (TIGR01451 family)